ncbi:hypothetical protein Misp01_80780 [Microtetraspora sp. NBRC 13810]|nr:hypothetical protein Misp01_80780 [Microtetraspora sp. NBRC 13810]
MSGPRRGPHGEAAGTEVAGTEAAGAEGEGRGGGQDAGLQATPPTIQVFSARSCGGTSGRQSRT